MVVKYLKFAPWEMPSKADKKKTPTRLRYNNSNNQLKFQIDIELKWGIEFMIDIAWVIAWLIHNKLWWRI